MLHAKCGIHVANWSAHIALQRISKVSWQMREYLPPRPELTEVKVSYTTV